MIVGSCLSHAGRIMVGFTPDEGGRPAGTVRGPSSEWSVLRASAVLKKMETLTRAFLGDSVRDAIEETPCETHDPATTGLLTGHLETSER